MARRWVIPYGYKTILIRMANLDSLWAAVEQHTKDCLFNNMQMAV